MKRTLAPIILIITFFYFQHSFAQEISQDVIASGANISTNADINLSATIGQPIIGISGDSISLVEAGFWSGLGEIVTGIESEAEQVPLRDALVEGAARTAKEVTPMQDAGDFLQSQDRIPVGLCPGRIDPLDHAPG